MITAILAFWTQDPLEVLIVILLACVLTFLIVLSFLHIYYSNKGREKITARMNKLSSEICKLKEHLKNERSLRQEKEKPTEETCEVPKQINTESIKGREKKSAIERGKRDRGKPMEIIRFPFTVGKSFLNEQYLNPITILKKHYPTVRRHINFSRYPIIIHTSSSTLKGYISHHVAGWGPCYQIKKASEESGTFANQYTLGQSLEVEIRIFDERVEV